MLPLDTAILGTKSRRHSRRTHFTQDIGVWCIGILMFTPLSIRVMNNDEPARYKVLPAGFKPTTPTSVVWCSIQLSYGSRCRTFQNLLRITRTYRGCSVSHLTLCFSGDNGTRTRVQTRNILAFYMFSLIWFSCVPRLRPSKGITLSVKSRRRITAYGIMSICFSTAISIKPIDFAWSDVSFRRLASEKG